MLQPLSEAERIILIQLRDQGNEVESCRAQMILLSAESVELSAIAETVPLTVNQIRYWRREWDKRRLNIFPSQRDEHLPVSSNGAHDTETVMNEAPVEAVSDEIVLDKSEVIPGVTEPRLPLELKSSAGLLPDEPMSEAGRKVLLFHFERMLQNEPGSRTGEDIESVHDMRVATRRMRTAMQMFRPYFKKHALQDYRRRLTRIATVLGEVRDLDVMIDKAQRFAKSNPGCDLTPLIVVWEHRLKKARRRLISQIDSKKYAQFVEEFHEFLTAPGTLARKVDGMAPYQVRHIAPRLIMELYEQVRIYETVLEEADLVTLHALRIAFKRFRYALEFFEDVLGPEVKLVLKEVKTMQDHLGDLQDARVVGDVLLQLVDRHMREYSGVPIFMRPDITGVMQYSIAVEAEKQRLITQMPMAWENFVRGDVRRNLALALAAL